MGQSSLAARDMNDRRSGKPEDFEHHVSTLILQLEELLAERPRIGGQSQTSLRPSPGTPRNDEYPPDHRIADLKSFPQGRAARARELIRQRQLRSQFLPPSLFGEPGWDMLLDLYAAHYQSKPVSVSSLCIASGVPATTALRAIETMEREGCLIRERDPSDKRRIFLRISEARRAELDAYFDQLGS
ncbi:DNA-binding transcriptional regulator, MarR family [Sphingopyxis sp. YR583]|uniref:MarR family winged helix-turn-helix transcriptional regulator n=1 Tax=Sphingopyxis sp. YR583 TaxID=1881047 RepID=UPI0008A76617|nr:MarR family winged helix-turn-helix transcriptional regulator [Sphingopyxis sp. YR583]SEH12520.1 DNA-binding transcriptional regulator, MarR family [Sphingopyxis sp. YR583]